MTQDKPGAAENGSQPLYQTAIPSTYYALLGVKPSASVREIRQAYRDLSKLYHPDTTQLAAAIATAKFQQLNEAYATLSNIERRTAYDQKIGYSRVIVSQPLPSLNKPQPKYSSSAYLDPTDRPLSPGELFALFILGVTFVGCLILAIAIGLTRGDEALEAVNAGKSLPEIIEAITTEQTANETPFAVTPAPKIDAAPSLPIEQPAEETNAAPVQPTESIETPSPAQDASL